jgi:hypothetical protein
MLPATKYDYAMSCYITIFAFSEINWTNLRYIISHNVKLNVFINIILE